MREWLEAERGAKYVGVAGLAEAAARILAGSGAARQGRGTVTELPDERTVRYYLAEGLIPPAEEKQGTASVFEFRHLLRLLVVKKLQAEGLPIRAIRELVTGKTERQLERLLGAGQGQSPGSPAKGEALSYLESLLQKSPSAPLPSSAPPPAQAFSSAPLAPPSGAPRETWARVELEPGLELHVSDGYRAPQGEGALRRLAQIILNVLKAHGPRGPGRGRK
ncbi:MAG: MerR family transcriptional regulator [Acidobacteria bacterium]|nr:MerR family transcriptional regulator [Acidobacteriota bacterium]